MANGDCSKHWDRTNAALQKLSRLEAQIQENARIMDRVVSALASVEATQSKVSGTLPRVVDGVSINGERLHQLEKAFNEFAGRGRVWFYVLGGGVTAALGILIKGAIR